MRSPFLKKMRSQKAKLIEASSLLPSVTTKRNCCQCRRLSDNTTPYVLVLLLASVALYSCTLTFAFTMPHHQVRILNNSAQSGRQRSHDVMSTKLHSLFKDDDDDDDDDDDEDLEKFDYKTAAQIRKARNLLREAKKKMKEPKIEKVNGTNGEVNGTSKENVAASSPLPFFAARPLSSEKIKSKSSSGIVADGAIMAKLSNSEPWELRPINQMFAREPRSDYDGNLVEDSEGSKLAEKDLARNLMALKRQLQDEDFKKVFDQRNRWIGDVE